MGYQGNDDDDEFPYMYGSGQSRNSVSDMFLMVVNGRTGAVDDKYYMGGTSSASVAGSVDGVPRQTPRPRVPVDPTDPTGSTNAAHKNNALSDDIRNQESNKKGGGLGKVIAILFGLLAVGFGMYAVFLYYNKKQHADSQKSSIFQCLQKFDVEDIDLRRSPPGGWHGTYMNKLAYGINESENGTDAGGSEIEPLGGNKTSNTTNGSTNYEDQHLYSDHVAPTGDPSLGGGGSRSGYKDNFEIDGGEDVDDEPDEVDIRLQGKNLV